MKKKYYTSRLTICCGLKGQEGYSEVKINQLVYASSKKRAREAVKKVALEDGVKESEILEIRINDTIIGD